MTNAPGSARRRGRSAARRYLTLLFSDLTGSTDLAAMLEAEHYAALLAQLDEIYTETVERHGGTIIRIQGDGVLAMFGYPETLEDDGRRATEAALDLHARVRGLRLEPPPSRPITLTMHTGIHAGLVLLGQGDLVHGRFDVTGNAANIAAHLSDAAGPDEILVSAETLGPDRHLFLAEQRREVLSHGAPKPVRVLQVIDRLRRASRYEARSASGLHEFVGRHAELTRLEQLLGQTLKGHPVFVAIVSPPGLGKTRLAREFLGRCQESGCLVLRGYCESYLAATPLQPFLHILRELFQIEHGDDPSEAAARIKTGLTELGTSSATGDTLRSLLSAVDRPSGSPPPRRARLSAIQTALRDVFGAVAARQPLVMFVDDWQWADDATHQVLDAVCGIASGPILVLLATRGFGAADTSLRRAFTSLELPRLSDAEATQSIRRLLPAADPFLVGEICRYAGGNPLFIEELCHRAAEDSGARRMGRLQGGAAWLNVLIESRVARLPDAQASLVRSAAVVGSVMPAWLFERVTGCPAGDPRVLQLAEEDLLFPGEQPATLRFKHGITRDVIYESVGLHQRMALHALVAEALLQQGAAMSEGDGCEALAYHFDAAGRWVEAAHYSERAGDRAVLASALDRAQAQYRAALAALDRLEPSLDLAMRWNAVAQRLGLACVFDPSRSDLPLFERAVELARSSGDANMLAKAQYWLAYIHYALGDLREAIAHSEAARVAALAAADGKLSVQVDATLGQALAAAARYGPALELLDAAIEVKQHHRSGAGLSVGLAYSLATKGQVLADRGEFAASLACFDEALSNVKGVQHEVSASILGLRAAALLWQGRWSEAQESALQACRIGEQVRSLFTLSMGRAAAAYAHWMLGGGKDALQDLLDATAWLLPRGNLLFRSLNHGWLADALVAAGRLKEARLHAAYALRCSRRDDMIGAAMACRAMARAVAGARDIDRARRWLARSQAIARARDSAHERAANLLCSAQIETRAAQPAQASPLLDEAITAFRTMGMAWHEEQALRLRQRM